jgi:ribosomal protein S18 acetylase RimI-like enzyme
MPTAPFTLRPAAPADRAAVLALIPRLRAFGPPAYRTPEQMDAGEERALNRFFDAPPPGSDLVVAEGEGGALLGAAYVERATDYFTQEAHGHLSVLAVAAEAEGRGVGRALVEAVERWAAGEGYRFVTLNVFAGNRRAIALYERAGWRPEAVKYVRELSPSPAAAG